MTHAVRDERRAGRGGAMEVRDVGQCVCPPESAQCRHLRPQLMKRNQSMRKGTHIALTAAAFECAWALK